MFGKASVLMQQINKLITEIESQENDELSRSRKQLHAIESAIASLEKNGLPVPNDLMGARERLGDAIVDLDKTSVVLSFLEDELQSISKRIKLAGNSRGAPRRSQTERLQATIRADGTISVSRALLRDTLIATLHDFGGSSSKKDVEREMEKRLRGKLTDIDYEFVGVGIERWKESTQWIRYHLVQEGVMRNNSPRGIWELK